MIKAIIIDDEMLVAKDLALTLQNFVEVKIERIFTDSLTALEWVKSNPVDVVFSDIQMPKLDGLQLAGSLYEARPGIMIVFVTGYKEYAADSYDLEALDYLLKPVMPNKLAKTIDKINREITYRSTASEELRVNFFGGFDICINGEVAIRGDMTLQLAGYLAHKRGEFVNVYDIFDVLWPGSETGDNIYANRLRVMINKLRSCLAPCVKITIDQDAKRGYRLVFPESCCDVFSLTSLLRTPLEKITAATLDRVRAIYKSGYLANNHWEWAQGEAGRWQQIIDAFRDKI